VIEIICWGHLDELWKEFSRLNIDPALLWTGYEWRENEIISVVGVTQEEFDVLCNDDSDEGYCERRSQYYDELCKLSPEEIKKSVEEELKKKYKLTWMDCGWRYSEGSILGSTDYPYLVHGEILYGFEPKDFDEYEKELKEEKERLLEEGKNVDIGNIDLPVSEHDHLLAYICDTLGASQPRNVAAICVSLAGGNNLTLQQLFEKYQNSIGDKNAFTRTI